jgi:hypothetical protein
LTAKADESSTAGLCTIYLANSLVTSGVPSYTGDGTSGVLVWGAQLEQVAEETRTNSIRNNTMVGAVAGTPATPPTNWEIVSGGLTTSVVGVGTSGGINYIDVRFNGTTTTGPFIGIIFGTNTEVPAANGQTWTQSIYAAVVGGSGANITYIGGGNNMWGSGGTVYLGELAGAVFPAIGTLGSTLVRYVGTATIATANVTSLRPYLVFTSNIGDAVDITFRIGMPQMERGAFVTPVIATSGTAVTRTSSSTVSQYTPNL